MSEDGTEKRREGEETGKRREGEEDRGHRIQGKGQKIMTKDYKQGQRTIS